MGVNYRPTDVLVASDLTGYHRYWSVRRRGSDERMIVNFESWEDREYTSAVYVRGKVLDRFGWWHTGFVVDMDRLPEMEPFEDTLPSPEPEPFPVVVRFDWRHTLLRLCVPDDVAVELRDWTNEHWHEYHGFNAGYSDAPPEDSDVFRALAYLHSVQCHISDEVPFIEGMSYQPDRPKVLVATAGVRADSSCPADGFHIEG